MDIPEAEAYVAGVQRRSRAGWEQARFVAFCCLKPWSKDLNLDTFLQFPWEEEGKLSEEEQHSMIEEMRARVTEFSEFLKNKNNGEYSN